MDEDLAHLPAWKYPSLFVVLRFIGEVLSKPLDASPLKSRWSV